ncbi:hypothetical protein BH11ARM1_BH11ARM1_14950 [soil metagenome]
MKELFKQKLIGFGIFGGIGVIVISFILIWVFAAAGVFRGTYTRTPVTNEITDAGTMNLVPMMILFLAIGILMVIGSIGYGLWLVNSENTGPRNKIENFKVIARYAYDRNQNLVVDDQMIDYSAGVKFYVRGAAPSREHLEYQTTRDMWYQCGEGMFGEVELQGKWIGRFTPYIGVPEVIQSA